MLMKKKIKKAAALLCALSVLSAGPAWAMETRPGSVDGNNRVPVTFDITKSSNARNGMITVYKTKISDSELAGGTFNPDDLLIADTVSVPANADQVTYLLNMDGEASGLYYIRARIGAESDEIVFSYMDSDSFSKFMEEMAQNQTPEAMYAFFQAHKLELSIDLENDYTTYTQEEIKSALNNVINRTYLNLGEIKTALEYGLALTEVNKAADADALKAVLEKYESTLKISLGGDFKTLGKIYQAAALAELLPVEFLTEKQFTAAFESAVQVGLTAKALAEVKASAPEKVLEVFAQYQDTLKLDKEFAVFQNHVENNEKALPVFQEKMAGSDCKTVAELQKKFKDMAAVSAFTTKTDYIQYVALVNDSKAYLGLSGDYFTWKIKEALYEVNKRMIKAAAEMTTPEAIQTVFAREQEFVKKNILPGLEEKEEGNSRPTGGGGGGGGSKVNNVVLPPVTPANPTQEPEKTNPEETGFDDLDGYAWAQTEIEALREMGVVHGVAGNHFAPGQTLKKEEFAKMLASAFGLVDESAECAFTDVEKGAWYYPYIASLSKIEIVMGVGEAEFGVGREITREEICALLYRTMQYMGKNIPQVREKEQFADDEFIYDYAREAVYAMQRGGIVSGMDRQMFEPKTPTNRAMAAKVIVGLRNAMNNS